MTKIHLYLLFFSLFCISCKAQDRWLIQEFELEKAVKSVCHECRIIDISDLDGTIPDWYKGQNKEILNPGLVKGDFNGDGTDDYCCLIKNPKMFHINVYYIYTVVFLSKKTEYRRVIIAKEQTGDSLNFFITKVSGEILGKKLKNTAVNFLPFERDSYVLYWDDKKYGFSWLYLD